MGDIAKGVLGGGWSLLVGWVLPSAINLAVLLLAVGPQLRGDLGALDRMRPGTAGDAALLLLFGSILLGLVLNALQTLLYRFLEGYVLWPAWAYDHGCRVQRARRQRIKDRLETPDARLSPIRLGVLHERAERYPHRDEQVGPTSLANAIRRFEEYGHDRYRLDTQVLWNELMAAVPPQTSRAAETSRTSVDFFVALLYGHAGVAVAALAALPVAEDRALVLSAAALLCALVPLWYRSAVVATDEWAAAVRALVNLGRKPLADALGLELPQELAAERTMWRLVTRMSRRPYHPAAEEAFAPFRAAPGEPCLRRCGDAS
ncbi:hypothetical protein [Streptomyces cavernicola]|uniref:DUF4129 domain-containing protein n=1 Tax=Streptomyces cavernicola TaxID=3043613 RepID=A0ABT6SM68_9ACTN|nr:hypothetical protein [Streptomyces sp. B-S-A6]MDI3409065.1 hypothetical protein [Streptomyces sp. B-S-A6]